MRSEFVPLLPVTVSSLTAAFAASPLPCLLSLADALIDGMSGAIDADAAASFASLLDQLSARALEALHPSPLDNPTLLTALLSHADLYGKLLVPALASASSLPSLLNLAASVLGGCRQHEPLEAPPELHIFIELGKKF